MKNEIDSKFLLAAFEKIRQHGTASNSQYSLEGVTAYTDFDGYTVYMEDALVKLSFGFHNQYHFDYDSASHFEAFEKKLQYIVKTYWWMSWNGYKDWGKLDANYKQRSFVCLLTKITSLNPQKLFQHRFFRGNFCFPIIGMSGLVSSFFFY